MKKEKFEYVDQFRKISTLSRLPVQNSFNDIFDNSNEKEKNNKFMRLKKQPIVEQWPELYTENYIMKNDYIQEKVNNSKNVETQQYVEKDIKIRSDVQRFTEHSKNNCKTDIGNKKFKFFYKNASPPKKIAEESIGRQAYKIVALTASDEISKNVDLYDNNKFDNLKYDFHQINKAKNEGIGVIENLQIEEQEDLEIMKMKKKFESYNDIHSIMNMPEKQFLEKDFMYLLNEDKIQENEQNKDLKKYLLSKFIYKSAFRNQDIPESDIQYFRDIGLPSRDLKLYTNIISQKQNRDPIEEQMRQQAHLLHLLKEPELNIEKNSIRFEDLVNISMGRVTSLNAYLCVRSEKVTKAQFDKLLRKLDKYRKQEKEKNNNVDEIGINTEDIENQEKSGQKTSSQDHFKNPLWELINEIMKLRQQAAKISKKNRNKQLTIQQNAFHKELYTRMEVLMKKLYPRIVLNPKKYPLSNLPQILENQQNDLKQILTPEAQDGKVLWFIIDSLSEMTLNMPNEDNIKSLLKKKTPIQPKLNYYKGSKLVKEDNIRSINLFTYRDKKTAMPAQRDRTPTKTSVTPSRKAITPIKGSTTAHKSPFSKTSAKENNIKDKNLDKSTEIKKLWKY